jgi:hypothetical protein
MNQTTQTNGGLEESMDLSGAATMLDEARVHAARELRVRRPLLFALGGLATLIADGAVWLSVRDQRPYQGPSGGALAVLLLIVVAAVLVSVAVVDRAASGVTGTSSLQRRVGASALTIGFAGVIALELALAHAGASKSVAYGVFAASAPVIVTGVVFIANSAQRLDWPLCGLGVALIVVAAAGAFAGARAVWAIIAIAGALAFELTAAVKQWLLPA